MKKIKIDTPHGNYDIDWNDKLPSFNISMPPRCERREFNKQELYKLITNSNGEVYPDLIEYIKKEVHDLNKEYFLKYVEKGDLFYVGHAPSHFVIKEKEVYDRLDVWSIINKNPDLIDNKHIQTGYDVNLTNEIVISDEDFLYNPVDKSRDTLKDIVLDKIVENGEIANIVYYYDHIPFILTKSRYIRNYEKYSFINVDVKENKVIGKCGDEYASFDLDTHYFSNLRYYGYVLEVISTKHEKKLTEYLNSYLNPWDKVKDYLFGT